MYPSINLKLELKINGGGNQFFLFKKFIIPEENLYTQYTIYL